MKSLVQFDSDSRALLAQLEMITHIMLFAIWAIHGPIALTFDHSSSIASFTSCKTWGYVASWSQIFADTLITKMGTPFQQFFVIGHSLHQEISLIHQHRLSNALTFAVVWEHPALLLWRYVEIQVSACCDSSAAHSIKLLSPVAMIWQPFPFHWISSNSFRAREANTGDFLSFL